MKKYVKTFSKIIITLSMLLCLCMVTTSNRSHADAGYHSNYSSGGSSSSSSHSSSSHSSYSSSRRSSSGSSYSSSSDGGGSLGGLIVWIIVIIIIIVVMSRKKGNLSSNISKLQSNSSAIAKLKELVPEFDEKQFLQNGYNIFLNVEDAWMNFDLEKVREVITDEMFNMYESQLSSMEIKGEQNIMNGFNLRDCAITRCVEQNDNIEVSARYIIEFYDYIIEKESGKVLRGSKTSKLRMDYDFTFIMSKTQSKITNCPNCGAPVDINSSGTCPYCNSKIIGENANWVMSKKVCTHQTNL